jgi:hypothetical protein
VKFLELDRTNSTRESITAWGQAGENRSIGRKERKSAMHRREKGTLSPRPPYTPYDFRDYPSVQDLKSLEDHPRYHHHHHTNPNLPTFPLPILLTVHDLFAWSV